MLPRLKNLLAVLLLAGGLPACATITSGTSQSLSVVTEPPGATCTMTRGGTVMGIVNPTPGTVTVSKSSRELGVRCTRAGHAPGVATVVPQFQPMTVGNILIGGFVGLAVDAASGAISRYPETVTLALPPEGFPNAQARDTYFAARSTEARQSFGERTAAMRSSCGPNRGAECDAGIAQLTRDQDNEIARLERLRLSARTAA